MTDFVKRRARENESVHMEDKYRYRLTQFCRRRIVNGDGCGWQWVGIYITWLVAQTQRFKDIFILLTSSTHKTAHVKYYSQSALLTLSHHHMKRLRHHESLCGSAVPSEQVENSLL